MSKNFKNMEKSMNCFYALVLLFSTILSFSSCEEEETKLVSNLEIKIDIASNVVTLEATAENAISFNWIFSDGEIEQGSKVEKVYTELGTYTAYCTAVGETNEVTDSVEIVIDDSEIFVEELKIKRSFNKNTVVLEAEAKNAAEFIWDFRDGKIGKGASVGKDYDKDGVYWIKCTALGAVDSVIDSVEVDMKLNFEMPSRPFGTGFRYSNYGPSYNPGEEYWWQVGERIANDFGDNATPECIWILGTLFDSGVFLNFPVETTDKYIRGTATVDRNENILCHFDTIGYKVWLQVESGYANMDTLIKLVLDRYSHHPCITGFGVDVEWHRSTNPSAGEKVTDELANKWIAAVREYNPEYRIFLKHWLKEKMPDTVRNGFVFVDDSQGFKSLSSMKLAFRSWGNYFEPAGVGFQYGYATDKRWWGKYNDPNRRIGEELLNGIPNAESLFWVDFTLLETYPPESLK